MVSPRAVQSGADVQRLRPVDDEENGTIMEQPRQLIDTQRRMILCPRCEREQPMRDYAILEMSPLYAELLAQVYRCKLCDHLFAPRAPLL